MKPKEWSPGALLGLSGQLWQTCAIHAAVKLGVFTLIDENRLSAKEVSAKSEADEDGMTRLLNALVAMDLLEIKDNRFANVSAGKRFLSKHSKEYIGFMLMHQHHLVESWARLDQAVVTGKPVRGRISFDDEEKREAFLMGMFNNAMFTAPQLVKEFDMAGRHHLLDMGGGPGTYAIHFCLANPGLKASIFDLPTTKPFAEKTVSSFGLRDRIDFCPCNYVNEDLKGRYDAVWMSHIIHSESPDTVNEMIKKAVAVLEPGGMIMIHDFFLNDEKTGPLFPALFSMNMLIGTDGGRSYSEREIMGMMESVGLKKIQKSSYRSKTDSSVITGVL